jgi:hypothetical protein
VGRGLGGWLRHGGPWRPVSLVCRRCGGVRAAGSVAYLAGPPGWWSVPLRLAGLLRRRRGRAPAPATYLLVAAAVWLGFLSSAFWGGAGGRSLATERCWW